MEGSEEQEEARRYEREHVHEIYESIASHFSQTRYKPWPIVAEFLARQPVGSIGLDLGSGNGKYLHAHNVTHVDHRERTNEGREEAAGRSVGLTRSPSAQPARLPTGDRSSRYLMLGIDRSRSLLSLSRSLGPSAKPHYPHDPPTSVSLPEVIHGDCLSLPFRADLRFDFIISIATLHHLSTAARRLEAIELLLASLLPVSSSSVSGRRTGRALIFVWAHEQGPRSRRKWDRAGALLPAPEVTRSSSGPSTAAQLLDPSHPPSSSSPLASLQDVLVPWTLNTTAELDSDPTRGPLTKTYNRYYHLFRQGELIQLVRSASERLQLTFQLDPSPPESHPKPRGWCSVKRHGWEADNWWVELELGRSD